MVGHSLVLVPIDLLSENAEILAFADEQASLTGSSLLLLHVFGDRDPQHQRPPEALPDSLEDCAKAIKRVPEARVMILVMEGEPVQKIVEVAKLYRCSAIVMGRGGEPEAPGRVAAGVKKAFRGHVHWVSTLEIAPSLDLEKSQAGR